MLSAGTYGWPAIGPFSMTPPTIGPHSLHIFFPFITLSLMTLLLLSLVLSPPRSLTTHSLGHTLMGLHKLMVVVVGLFFISLFIIHLKSKLDLATVPIILLNYLISYTCFSSPSLKKYMLFKFSGTPRLSLTGFLNYRHVTHIHFKIYWLKLSCSMHILTIFHVGTFTGRGTPFLTSFPRR